MTALQLNGLNKAFGGLRVTSEFTTLIAAGERRLIIGPNGAGKTTLFNLITGELKVDSGTIKLFGNDITRQPNWKRAHLGVARTYQVIRLFPNSTLIRNVMLSAIGLSSRRWSPFRQFEHQTEIRESAAQALKSVGLGSMATRYLSETSYGERRRVEIAMALVQNPRVLLLDEPFAGLSVDERHHVLKVIQEIPRNVTIVMIEHDMTAALEFAEQITVMHFGKVVCEGTRPEVVADPRVQEIYFGS